MIIIAFVYLFAVADAYVSAAAAVSLLFFFLVVLRGAALWHHEKSLHCHMPSNVSAENTEKNATKMTTNKCEGEKRKIGCFHFTILGREPRNRD